MEPTILVVEDDEVVRSVLCKWLQASGYATTEASDGIEALAAFGFGQHVAVITDFNMPRLDGAELIHILKEHEPSLPILLVTGGNVEMQLIDLIRYPRFSAVKKPYQSEAIIGALKRLMETPYEPETFYKRSAFRFNVNLEAQVANHGPARITSLSKNGCFVATHPRVPVGASVSIKFQNLSLAAKAVWIRDANNSGGFPEGLGLQFSDQDAEACRDLQVLLIREMAENKIGWLE